MLAILLLAVQPAPLKPLPSPPVVLTQVDRPPPYPAVVSRYNEDLQRDPVPVEIDVRAGNEILWSGSLRVAFGNNSAYSVERSEPPVDRCNERYRVNQTQLRLSLSFQRENSAGERLRISTTWRRPASNQTCTEAGLSRTVTLEDVVDLPAGSTRQIHGDAGIVITLRRR